MSEVVKGQHKGPSYYANALYLVCLNVNILVVSLLHSLMMVPVGELRQRAHQLLDSLHVNAKLSYIKKFFLKKLLRMHTALEGPRQSKAPTEDLVTSMPICRC